MKKERFNQLLFTPESDKKECKQLRKVTKEFPWFVLPSVLILRNETNKKTLPKELRDRLTLNLMANSYFSILGSTISRKKNEGELVDLIDAFLVKNAGRIRPDKPYPNYVNENLAKEVELDIVTEKLAQIYLNQGLKEEAIDIYRKLSLKYPEKSSYFAQIIDTIPLMDKKEGSRQNRL